MMKKSIALIVLLCVFLQGWTQSKNIEFKVDKDTNALNITGYNNTDEDLEITLIIKDIKLLKGYTKPITKVVPAKSNTLFVKLTFEYDFYKYKISYSFKKVPTKIDNKIAAYNKKNYYLKDVSKINEGIVVFDDEGCGNCRLVTNYLVANNFDFKIVDLSAGKENTKLMWKMIKEKGADMNVKSPVIIVNGKLSHSHKDLKVFLESMKK
jgi:glutaredoxin